MLSTETCARKKSVSPSENRVGDFFSISITCAGQNHFQALEPHQTFSTTSTTTVSGVVYWLSKDPIGISGGFNLYEAFGSNPVYYRDPFGRDLSYGYAYSSQTSKHQKTAAGDYAQSFGPAEGTGLWGKIAGSETTQGPNASNTGDGIVYDNSSAPFTKILESMKTTPAEDAWLASEMKKEIDKRGNYAVNVNDCQDYSKGLYDRMKALLLARRAVADAKKE